VNPACAELHDAAALQRERHTHERP
jgi:hypothetical protein